MAKKPHFTDSSSAIDIARRLAQAGPALDLTKLLADSNASGETFRNATRAISHQSDLVKNSSNAAEIAKALSQIPSTQDLAKHIAEINSSSEALKAISNDLSRHDEAIRNSLDAKGIADALTNINALGNVGKKLTDAIPQVNLHLPGVSEPITAALPRALPDGYLPRSSKSSEEDNNAAGAASPRHSGVETLDLEIVSASDIGRLVRRAREARHLSQQSFADLAGVGRRFLSELENGKPTLELGKVLKVAHAAGLTLLARER